MSDPSVGFIIHNLKQVVTLAGSSLPRRGKEMSELAVIEDGAIVVANGKIAEVGSEADLLAQFPNSRRVDGQGAVCLPGFVDPHTHLPFYGTRENDFEARILGKSYAEIALAGGGIRSTMRATRKASLDDLVTAAKPRLDRMLCSGTTTAEAKSGYGLNLETERRQLLAIKELDEVHPVDLVATNLAAHEVPDEYREDKEAYIRLLCDKLLPELKELAQFCDIFCEDHVYSAKESRRILSRAKEHGYQIKIHADEIESVGGAELACELGAVSADHLGRISEAGIKGLASCETIAVLLPGTTFYLNLPNKAPARKMIEAGVAVALATDLNPGSCLTESMPAILTIACADLRMTPGEVITAATINAAHAVGMGDSRGSLERGKWADFVLWDIPHWRYLPTHFGVNLVKDVYKKGRRVVQDGRRVSS
ncbi:MAG: imidazolonepropionase [Planctomycetota bacterium]|nr:imidazolonepropionase [Planctomycetota bacterium]